MLVVTGSVVAKPDHFEELFALSQEHVTRSRTEPGCLSHAVYRDPENPLRLVFVEEWADRMALLVHFGVQGSRDFAKSIKGMAAEPPELNVYEAERVPFP
ncbi:MAG: antibiotic biosynthesis monooxygenase [Blastocatellia bacterium]|nr:antibiotic biosynthesis monooxygenase [Blastocatellia bacterium]